jgi:hypothetical protein
LEYFKNILSKLTLVTTLDQRAILIFATINSGNKAQI